MSASGLPSYGTSLPSNLDRNMAWVGLPSALTPSPVNFIPPGVASNFSVRLLGAGPGLYLDFARSSFQVPSQLSAAMATELETTMAQHAASETMSRFFRMNYLLRAKKLRLISGTVGFHRDWADHTHSGLVSRRAV